MTRECGLLAVAALFAWRAPALVYWHLIVPRLLTVERVPVTWWALMVLPLGLVTTWAGYRSRSLLQVLAGAAAIVLPHAVIESVFGLVTGQPVAYELHVHDTHYVLGPYWLVVFELLLAFAVAIGLVALLAGLARRSFGVS
jgi:hypothetical protein